ncbi:hypothetical protein BD770DRAFT_359584, partial [Pilaira anomala]
MNSLGNHPPGGFNKEKLQGLVQRVRFLQSQGAKEENNPEYAQIMNFLKNLQKQQQSRPTPVEQPTVPDMPSAFSQSQLAALKYQILAYKLISKNLVLPPNLQQAVLSP